MSLLALAGVAWLLCAISDRFLTGLDPRRPQPLRDSDCDQLLCNQLVFKAERRPTSGRMNKVIRQVSGTAERLRG